MADGPGVETWKDGSKYDGIFCKFKKQGKGKYTWIDNSIYDGEWDNN